jgi:DNA-binding NtrC family response regulator
MTPSEEHKRTILIHSADRDLIRSLTFLLQDQYAILASESVASLEQHRGNRSISMLVVDLEKNIPQLLEEFGTRREAECRAPIIVLYAFRQSMPEWESMIRHLANQILYKPAQIEQILNAIAIEEKLHPTM